MLLKRAERRSVHTYTTKACVNTAGIFFFFFFLPRPTTGIYLQKQLVLGASASVSPPRCPASEVPVVHVQVAEPRLQAGQARRRVLQLGALVARDGRHGQQELGQGLGGPPFDLRGEEGRGGENILTWVFF